ncbi:transposase [Candidatus Dependentiae bacterium]|nr:transposase [Candidatus Dependentiae bacterium]
MVDALGNLLKMIITPGTPHDSTQAEALLVNISNAYVVADKGYDSKLLRNNLVEKSCIQ